MHHPRPQPGSRGWAALGLAAAMAAPFGVVQISQLYAEDVKPEQLAGPRPTDSDLLRQATDEFRLRQYEQAEKTLAAVKSSSLSDNERDAYLSLSTDVKHAAIECRAAREEFLSGEDALKAQQDLEAISHFKAVALNKFADEATVKKAQARLVVLDTAPDKTAHQVALASDPKPAVTTASQGGDLTPAHRYELGLGQYRAGQWNEARQNLEIARAAGYTPESIYQDSPTEILNRISARDQAVHERERVVKLTQAADQATTQPSNANDPLAALRATDDAEKLRRQQAAAQAQQLVQDAQTAERNNDYNRALDLYSRAIDLDPNNAAAIQGRDMSMRMVGRNPAAAPAAQGNLPDQAAADVRARQGEIKYQIQSNLDQAHAAIQAQNWAGAQTAIDRARLATSLDPTIFPQDQIRQFRQQIDQADLDLHRAQEEAKAVADRTTAAAIEAKIQAEREQALRDRQNTIADLIRTSRNLTDQGKYREALQTVDQILVLDPNNDYAVGVKPLLEDKVQFAQQRQYKEQRLKGIGDQLIRAQEELVPYNDILRYPTDWPDISQTRDQTVAAERSSGSSDRLATAQLDRQLPALTFDAVGFSDVIDFLRDVSGSNIFVNWKSLEAAGIDRNTPVSANLRNVKFSKALNVILDSVGGGQTKLGYTVDEGVITISTQDDLSRNVVVRVYDIRDLIVNIPDFTDAPAFSLDQSQSSGGGGGSGQPLGQQGGSGQINVSNQLFQNANQIGQNGRNQGPTRQDLVDSITKLIEDTVSTDSWKDNGGSVGALRELEGQLIVTQTPENHRQLINLLEQLREERAIQVTVETRFLTVQRNFLEDVGVDLNFLFNLNSSWSNKFGTIPLTTPNSNFTLNPTTGVPGSLGSSTATPTGLTTSATYLDDFQVTLVMRAVQASVTSTVVTAPRLTLFNGQRAYVLVTTTRAYVSNLTPVVSTGVSAFAPTVSFTQSGVILDVQATVSADRKYVTLTLRPSLNTLLDLLPFTFQTGASVVSNNGPLGSTVTSTPSGTIQEPETQVTQVRTTVSVPDGGTLLIGGQTLAGEVEREIGVPVLSKIPILKRLFTNKSTAKDEQVLLILVRPTIIMQREIEQKQFPLLASKLTNG
jgi:general secretion pathway protein D